MAYLAPAGLATAGVRSTFSKSPPREHKGEAGPPTRSSSKAQGRHCRPPRSSAGRRHSRTENGRASDLKIAKVRTHFASPFDRPLTKGGGRGCV